MHSCLQETLQLEFPIVTLFEHPTVRSLARHLGRAGAPVAGHGEEWRDRAQRQKQALVRLRDKAKRERQ
jgi:hypothetical protein